MGGNREAHTSPTRQRRVKEHRRSRFRLVGVVCHSDIHNDPKAQTWQAGAVLLSEQLSQGRRQAHSEEFQRLVGGVGFGPAVDLSGCAFSFDPRLDGACAEECGAIPGGSCFCPRHAFSVFAYPSVRSEPEANGRRGETILFPDLEPGFHSP